ncbi:MAG TPA: molybdopterin-dependent oxidoreductase [Gemmatimonadales bacterium]|jgi:DMSO/TMAO reductase YedYZ molybdopterin-dependent catalytic subunit|nr:molybdopterin-dependent oxidoreductase [Gemmatimonadales bacterium]
MSARDPLFRREFLRRMAPVVPAVFAAACGWDGGKRLQPVFDRVIDFDNHVGEALQAVRHAQAPAHQVVRGTMPTYFVSKSLPVLADPAAWRLEVGGLVKRPASYTQQMLAQLPHIAYTVTHHCVEGWSVVQSWGGVPFAVIAQLAEPLPGARFVQFDSFDDGYMNGWDIASAMHPQTILADAHQGKPITAEHGAPLRLYSPIKLGYKLTKYLTRITFTDRKPGGYWEDQGYPWFGGL